jgi:NTP pyrophosphatase (non-canonical NTP hydrolase)
MVDINKIAELAHACACKRGKITGHHDYEEFMKDLASEFAELACAGHRGAKCVSSEIADVILVCLSVSYHYNIDAEKAIKDKMLYN